MQAIIFIGIQATGKTTFYCQNLINTHVRISLDLLRTRRREREFLETCLRTRQRFVVDNTNPTVEDRKRYIDLARAAKYEVVGYYFQSEIEGALARNAQREKGARIPVPGIRATRAKLQLPSLAEGFDRLYYVRIVQEGKFEVEEWRSDEAMERLSESANQRISE